MRKYLVPGPIKQHLHCKNIRAVLKGTASLGCFPCWLERWKSLDIHSQHAGSLTRVVESNEILTLLDLFRCHSHLVKEPVTLTSLQHIECQNVKNLLFFTSTVIAHVACLSMQQNHGGGPCLRTFSQFKWGGSNFCFIMFHSRLSI